MESRLHEKNDHFGPGQGPARQSSPPSPRILFEQDCNIENVSQTILQNEFSGIFIVSVPKALSESDLHGHLDDGLSPMGLHVFEKPISDTDASTMAAGSERFCGGHQGPPTKKDWSRPLPPSWAAYQVNVTNLQAVFKGGDDPNANIMIYEVDIPTDTSAPGPSTGPA